MKTILVTASFIGAFTTGAVLAASSSSSSSSSGDSTVTTTGADGRNCEVVHKAAGERPGGPLTSTVTAGPNGVSGGTSGAGGVHVEAGGGHATSSAGPGGQTVTTDSSGRCTVTIYDRER